MAGPSARTRNDDACRDIGARFYAISPSREMQAASRSLARNRQPQRLRPLLAFGRVVEIGSRGGGRVLAGDFGHKIESQRDFLACRERAPVADDLAGAGFVIVDRARFLQVVELLCARLEAR